MSTSTTVNIAIYDRFDEADPDHGALHLAGPVDVVFQIVDDVANHSYSVDMPRYTAPQRSTRLKTLIPVGTIPAAYHDAAVATVQATPVDNTSSTWNCQAWVMDALAALEMLGLLEANETWEAEALARREYRQ